VAATSTLYKNLRAGIDAARDTTQRLLLDTYAPLSFRLKARLLVNPDHSPTRSSMRSRALSRRRTNSASVYSAIGFAR